LQAAAIKPVPVADEFDDPLFLKQLLTERTVIPR